jgi:hypothetical protein
VSSRMLRSGGLKVSRRPTAGHAPSGTSEARTVHEWGKRRNLFNGRVVEVPRTKVTRETGRAFTQAEARTILHAAQRVPPHRNQG